MPTAARSPALRAGERLSSQAQGWVWLCGAGTLAREMLAADRKRGSVRNAKTSSWQVLKRIFGLAPG